MRIKQHAIDRIVYTTPFKENVQGRLMARFRLDPEGTPIYEPYQDEPRLRVYTIDMFLVTPFSTEIKGVRYYLNDPSYINPEGYTADADNKFREEISTYGDVEILITVEMLNQKKYEQRAWLSHMLENGHADDMTQEIRTALGRIRIY